MNRINPRKLINSKWTAVSPVMKEKHFIVTKVTFDEEGDVTQCLLEAVMTRRVEGIDWQQLKDARNWQQGWR